MSKHNQNKTVFYDIRPPYGAVFQMNIDGSIKLVFDPSKIDDVGKWVEEMRNTFAQIVQITKAQQKMAESPLDRPVRLAISGPGIADLSQNQETVETEHEPAPATESSPVIETSAILEEEK